MASWLAEALATRNLVVSNLSRSLMAWQRQVVRKLFLTRETLEAREVGIINPDRELLVDSPQANRWVAEQLESIGVDHLYDHAEDQIARLLARAQRELNRREGSPNDHQVEANFYLARADFWRWVMDHPLLSEVDY